MRVGQELLGTLSVVLEQVDRAGNLQDGLLPRLSRLPLEQLRDALIVVQQPVTQAPDPFAPAGRSERIPRRLVAPQPPDGGAHLLGAPIGQESDHGAIRGRPHLEARTRLRAVPRRPRSDRVRTHGHHLGVARPHQSFDDLTAPHDRHANRQRAARSPGSRQRVADLTRTRRGQYPASCAARRCNRSRCTVGREVCVSSRRISSHSAVALRRRR